MNSQNNNQAATPDNVPSYLAKHVSTKQRGNKIILTLELDGVEPAPRYKVTPVNPAVVRSASVEPAQHFAIFGALAKSMIPSSDSAQTEEWNSRAQAFVASVLRKLAERNMLSIKNLLHYVQVASPDQLRELLAGTPGESLVASANTFVSVRTIAVQYLTTHLLDVFDDLLRLQRDFAAPGETKPAAAIMRKLQSAGFKLAAGVVEQHFGFDEFPPPQSVEIRQPLPAAMRAPMSRKKRAKKVVNAWLDKRDVKLKKKARKDLRKRIAAVIKDAR